MPDFDVDKFIEEMRSKIDDFTGDDDINWSEHAIDEAKKGWWTNPNREAFDYFRLEIPSGAQCLEIGCNIGRWAPVFKACGWEYTGIDASYTAILLADKKFTEYLFLCMRGEEIGAELNHNQFDLVFTNTALQHMHNENKALVIEGIAKVLKPYGYLVIQESTTPSLRTFDSDGWVQFIDPFGFQYITGTPPGDNRNGLVFRRKE